MAMAKMAAIMMARKFLIVSGFVWWRFSATIGVQLLINRIYSNKYTIYLLVKWPSDDLLLCLRPPISFGGLIVILLFLTAYRCVFMGRLHPFVEVTIV